MFVSDWVTFEIMQYERFTDWMFEYLNVLYMRDSLIASLDPSMCFSMCHLISLAVDIVRSQTLQPLHILCLIFCLTSFTFRGFEGGSRKYFYPIVLTAPVALY